MLGTTINPAENLCENCSMSLSFRSFETSLKRLLKFAKRYTKHKRLSKKNLRTFKWFCLKPSSRLNKNEVLIQKVGFQKNILYIRLSFSKSSMFETTSEISEE